MAVFRLTGRLDGKKGIKELRKFQTKRINTLLKKKKSGTHVSLTLITLTPIFDLIDLLVYSTRDKVTIT